MVMCSKCQKRVAVVFVTRLDGGKKTSEGLCIKCARDLGVPVDNMLSGSDGVFEKFGLTPESIEGFEDQFAEMMQEMGEAEMTNDGDEGEDGGAPAIDIPKLFEDAGIPIDKDASSNILPIPEKREKSKSEKKKKSGGKEYKFLTTYCKNLTRYASEGKLDRIVGRDSETERVIQILCRRQKNNPCLIGEPGVGKTAIAEGLALRMAEGKVPYKLQGKELFLVDMTAMVAGTQFRGQFESRILGLLADVKEHGNAILVIDEVHNIVGVGAAEGSMNAANILKPALSRGEVRIIGATTLNEYRKYIEKDSALERRFQPVTVNEPSVGESVEMLRGISHYYEDFHRIHIPEGVLRQAVVMSERYITDRYLPDKAIDLIDEAASRLSISSAALNETMELRDKLLRLKDEREELEASITADDAESQKKYEKLANYHSEELRLADRIAELESECELVVLNEENLAEVVEMWTCVPASSITENEFKRIDKLSERIREHIVGQDEAVDAVCRAIKRSRAGISYKRKPVSFIFAGPTGIGKTELVKTIAADLFHSPETLIRLDMSEFMEKHSVSKIIGAPPGYVGYDDGSQLTEKIRRRPYSVVLFDEIEKAHRDVLNVLLQILDDGRITDAQGKTVNFENTIIVMTTNAGSESGNAVVGFSQDSARASRERTEKALATFLRPEFINRVDEIITFRSLDRSDFTQIAKIMLGQLAAAMAERGMTLEYTDEAARKIAEESFSEKYGARNMRRYIQKNVEDKLAELIIADYTREYSCAVIDVDGGELAVRCK